MTDSQRHRYSRQMRLPEVGEEGQQRLADASVLVIGAGGLGSPALHHLAASGVGRIGIIEFDTVDVSNLHRQTLYTTADVGTPKTEAAARRLALINPDVQVDVQSGRLDAQNASDLIGAYDVVLDGSDTFETRYVVNDASVSTGTPNVYASVGHFSGQASVLGVENGPCYRCLFPEPPPAGLIPNCEEGGVLGVVPSLLGTIQATEALKLILGIGTPLVGRLLLLDALAMEVREIEFSKDPACPACGEHRQPLAPAESVREITAAELRASAGDAFALLDVREAAERREFDIGGRLIPLGQLETRAFELDDVGNQPIVVYCKSGGRSGRAARLLADRGFDVRSLRGGMDAWRASEPA